MTASQNPTPARFLARQCYDQLEQALVPIGEALQDLKQDWKPRPPAFWERLVTCLAQIQQALSACIAVASTASIAHRSCLYYVIGRVEDVGARLAAYQDASSSAQQQLRQRHVVLHALRELHEGGQEMLAEGRAWLDQVQQDHALFRAPLPRSQAARSTVGKSPPASRRKVLTASRTPSRSTLQLVKRQEPEEDLPNPASSG